MANPLKSTTYPNKMISCLGCPDIGPLSQFSLKNEPGPICSKLTGDLPPWWRQAALKMANPYLHSPWSSTAPSKCAKSHLEPLARDEVPSWVGPYSSTPGLNFDWKLNTWSDLLLTHRGPAPYQWPSLLKMASPYHHPPWSSACMSKCAKWCLEEIPQGHLPECLVQSWWNLQGKWSMFRGRSL